MKKNSHSRKKRFILSVCIALVLVLVAAPAGLALYIYQGNFGHRFDRAVTSPWAIQDINDFEGLQRDRYSFVSDQGQTLAGYRYYKDETQAKGVIIIAHGFGGGGHNTYMGVADYLTSAGYHVFAYDATGTDESEGESVNGLPQGVIDLDAAIRFIKSNSEFDELPLMLFGHSWGAYSSGSILKLHPDIKAVAMISGFDQYLDIITDAGQKQVGALIHVVSPYIKLIDTLKFGSYTSFNCMDGFAASEAGILIAQSADDELISFEEQFVVFSEKYQDDPRFVFLRYEDRGHENVISSEASIEYQAACIEQFKAYAQENGLELNAANETAFMGQYVDKALYFELDSDFMDRVVSFYDVYADQ